MSLTRNGFAVAKPQFNIVSMYPLRSKDGSRLSLPERDSDELVPAASAKISSAPFSKSVDCSPGNCR